MTLDYTKKNPVHCDSENGYGELMITLATYMRRCTLKSRNFVVLAYRLTMIGSWKRA
jgi:hypothetical protein